MSTGALGKAGVTSGHGTSGKQLADALPDLQVGVFDERDYAPDASPSVRDEVVYRMFLYDDVAADLSQMKGISLRASQIRSGFETEVLSSKRWLALFHDEAFRQGLSSSERAIIDEFVPMTFLPDPVGMAELLANKEAYVLKHCRSFGGKSVYVGGAHSAAELKALIDQSGTDDWVVQRYIESPKIHWPTGEAREPHELKTVFGIYSIGGEPAGVLVRAHPSSDVVNIASGGAGGWALLHEGKES